MALLRAKMRHIDHGCGIIREKSQDFSRRHRAQAFRCLEDRERTQEPARVKIIVALHGEQLRGMLQFVHRTVSPCVVTFAGKPARAIVGVPGRMKL